MAKTTIIEGWTWTADIGLFWGEGPDGTREQVLRPKMTSPWWVIGDPDPLGEDSEHVYWDGAVTLIFSGPTAAANHVIATHRPVLAFEVEPTVTYEVWERNLRTGDTTRWGGNPGYGYPLNAAEHQVDKFNEDQKYHDRYETGPTPTREFFIVEATTTYQPYTGPKSQ